jgi:hypothetical protein
MPAALAHRHLVFAGRESQRDFLRQKEGRAETWTDRLWVYDLRTSSPRSQVDLGPKCKLDLYFATTL